MQLTKKITWISSNEKIATVTNGKVTALDAGIATISCISEKDGRKVVANCTVEVYTPATSITLENKTLSLLVNQQSAPLTYTISPENAYYQEVSWISSDETVASVDVNGIITAHKAGTATVTASSCDPVLSSNPKKQVACKVTVIQPAETIELSHTRAFIPKGSKLQISATVLPEDTTDEKITWTSADENVAAVSSGSIIAKNTGTTSVVCTVLHPAGKKITLSVARPLWMKFLPFQSWFGGLEDTNFTQKKWT